MISLAFVNNKGGCGKTTGIFQISGVLAERGQRVLVIDLDGQCNATSTLLGNSSIPDKTIYDVLTGAASVEDAIAPAMYASKGCRNMTEHGIDCVAGDSRLLDSNVFASFGLDYIDALRLYESAYDVVLIDLPPSNSGANSVGFRLADKVIVPMTSADMYAINGVGKISDTVESMRHNFNETLEIVGVYFSNYFESPVQSFVVDCLRGGQVRLLKTKIPRSSAVTISTVNARPLAAYAPNEKATIAYEALTDEIMRIMKGE